MPSPRAADDARRPARAAPRRRATRLVLVGTVAVGLLLAACTGAPSEAPTPSRSATVSPSPEPSATPTTTAEPERPAAMDDAGVDGAVAAATYFLSLFPYVYESGDLTAWKAMSHPECVFCASVVSSAEEMHTKGNHQQGPSVTIEEVVGREVDPGVFFAVDVRMIQGPITEFGPDGAVVDEAPASEAVNISLAVVRVDGRWVVRGSEAADAAA
jgi:hypothetical protein